MKNMTEVPDSGGGAVRQVSGLALRKRALGLGFVHGMPQCETRGCWHAERIDQSAWTEVTATMAAAPYPVKVLPADAAQAQGCLAALGITTGSWLGAVVANTGGVLIDHGWLRVLGYGHGGLPSVAVEPGRLTVGHDVLGGQFAWLPARPGAKPTVHYFGPDTLS
jgi:hypothetical protein